MILFTLMIWYIGLLFTCGLTASTIDKSEELDWHCIGYLAAFWPYKLARLIS